MKDFPWKTLIISVVICFALYVVIEITNLISQGVAAEQAWQQWLQNGLSNLNPFNWISSIWNAITGGSSNQNSNAGGSNSGTSLGEVVSSDPASGF